MLLGFPNSPAALKGNWCTQMEREMGHCLRDNAVTEMCLHLHPGKGGEGGLCRESRQRFFLFRFVFFQKPDLYGDVMDCFIKHPS